ncbi:hypothetical protein [Mycetocola reblochoni]
MTTTESPTGDVDRAADDARSRGLEVEFRDNAGAASLPEAAAAIGLSA